jgi:hypothetical protein
MEDCEITNIYFIHDFYLSNVWFLYFIVDFELVGIFGNDFLALIFVWGKMATDRGCQNNYRIISNSN